ncbi:MAG: lysophospholipase [Deltaproteobacteria bacterium]|nr:lysophospholipase [Deltaproteobacteria bacterium]
MSIQKTDSYFKGHDNHRLYYESVLPKNPKAILVFVHGLNEHTGRYEHVVERFQNDYGIYLYDQRGHGQSDGIRAHVCSFNEYIQDLAEFVGMVKKNHPRQKIFMVAHSMGGQVLLNFLGTYPSIKLAGFITSSPNIKVAFKISRLKRFVGLKLSEHFPKFRFPSEVDQKWISRDPEVVKRYKNDPMVAKSISARLAAEIILNQEDVIMNQAPKITLPAFMMHAGDDRICAPEGSEEFFAKLGSQDKTLKIYPEYYHELFNDLDYEVVLDDMAAWLRERS